jgi:hypothetical protein
MLSSSLSVKYGYGTETVRLGLDTQNHCDDMSPQQFSSHCAAKKFDKFCTYTERPKPHPPAVGGEKSHFQTCIFLAENKHVGYRPHRHHKPKVNVLSMPATERMLKSLPGPKLLKRASHVEHWVKIHQNIIPFLQATKLCFQK